MSSLTHPLLAAAAQLAPPMSRQSLAEAYERLSTRYRADLDTDPTIGPEEVWAYAIARLPATLAAVLRVLADLREVLDGWQPMSVLDLGAGLGPAGWAAASTFESVDTVTFVERSPQMIALGEKLAAGSDLPAIARAEWIRGDVAAQTPRADLVVASYVLGELRPRRQQPAVEQWWSAADSCLVIIDAGTPAGYRRVLDARELVIGKGATIAAPCPHDAPCPLPADDWCHFGVRVTRTGEHRVAKGAVQNFEDEKYSYIAGSRALRTRPIQRVIRRPVQRSGHVRVRLCGPDGIDEAVISKRQGDAYREARDLRWGDHLSEPSPPE